jgi:hypothetical protein
LDGVTSAIQTQINTAGGLVKITDQSFSAASAVNVNNCFTSTYQNYRIVCDLTNAGANNITRMRLRASGSDDANNNYVYTGYGSLLGSTTISAVGATSTSFDEVSYNFSGAQDTSIVLDVVRPQTAFRTLILGMTTGQNTANNNLAARPYFGNFTNTTQFDGFSLLASTSTITGTVRVYGYRN